MNIGYNYSKTQYCCGAVIADNGEPGCKYEQPFTLTEATVLPDAAFLENNGDSNSTESCQPSSRSIAIEAGVSVPLGVIAIAAILWALWERRHRRNPKGLSAEGSEMGYVLPRSRQRRMAELNAPESNASIQELMDTGREYKEAPGEPQVSIQDAHGSCSHTSQGDSLN
jgi:hypothetical protein